jgi:hypothetical protein
MTAKNEAPPPPVVPAGDATVDKLAEVTERLEALDMAVITDLRAKLAAAEKRAETANAATSQLLRRERAWQADRDALVAKLRADEQEVTLPGGEDWKVPTEALRFYCDWVYMQGVIDGRKDAADQVATLGTGDAPTAPVAQTLTEQCAAVGLVPGLDPVKLPFAEPCPNCELGIGCMWHNKPVMR